MRILEAMAKMATDGNQGLRMTMEIVNVENVSQGSVVSFGTDREAGDSALRQRLGLPSEDLCVAFFINREELEKYK